MIIHTKFSIAFILTISFCACNINDKSKISNGKTDILKTNLIEKRIGKSDFYISLPPDYFIKQTNGPDFSVYYFSPNDSTSKPTFTGGLYFGNFPFEFEAEGDSCKQKTLQSGILTVSAKWTIYNCNSSYYLQTIIDSKSGEDRNEKVHAFGSAESETDMQKLLDIYATLRQGKK